jgi:hypothetical protein
MFSPDGNNGWLRSETLYAGGWPKTGDLIGPLQLARTDVNYIGNYYYEYRSGALIPVRTYDRYIVPDYSERVISFADYKLIPGVRPIRNLPGYWVRRNEPIVIVNPYEKFRVTLERKQTSEPPKPSRGLADAIGTHVFVQDLTELYHRKWGKFVYIGQLDAFGTFVPDSYLPPQEPEKFAGIVPNSRPLMLGPDGRREVYEFRAGRLVPGKLTDDDRFVPQVGGLIIHIRDYVYTPEARPIYNLPGRFYPKGMKINVAGREVPVEKIGNRWDLYPP